jgi:hypothetical protein
MVRLEFDRFSLKGVILSAAALQAERRISRVAAYTVDLNWSGNILFRIDF